MSYQALYRVWRPQTFDELVGQDMISQTLKNAVISKQTSHAYLFTGPRGTGKTSTAKILAKAVNCLEQTDGNPCNECQICRLINNDQLSDVVEIDAASNNGVEEIRNLRDNVRYAATQAENKVYIIDEVHMLTTGAFNALLKTLEEPPERVIFIMATTEPHKIPATILSRVQRFDFQRITDQGLTERMVEVLDSDNTPYDEEALAIIARAANGGMRDSISLLDQALSFNRDELTVQSALEVSGSLDQKVFVDYILALYQGQGQVALDLFQESLKSGKQASRFVEELIMFSRDMLLTKELGQNYTLLNQDEIQKLIDEVDPGYYHLLIDELSQTQSKMKLSTNSALYVEVVTIQLAAGVTSEEKTKDSPIQESTSQPAATTNTKPDITNQPEYLQLLGRVQALEAQNQKLSNQIHQIQRFGHTGESVGDSGENNEPIKEPAQLKPRKRPDKLTNSYYVDLERIFPVLNTATNEARDNFTRAWDQVLNRISPVSRAKFYGTSVLAAGPNKVLISCANQASCGQIQSDPDLIDQLEKISHDFFATSYEFVFISQDDWPQVRQLYAKRYQENQKQPVMPSSQDLELFPGPTPADEAEEPSATSEGAGLNKSSNEGKVAPDEKAPDTKSDQLSSAPAPTPQSQELAEAEQVKETGPFTKDDQLPQSVVDLIDLVGPDRVNIHYDK